MTNDTEATYFPIMREVTIPLVEKAQRIGAIGAPAETQLASVVLLHVWVHGTQPLSTHIAHSEIHSF